MHVGLSTQVIDLSHRAGYHSPRWPRPDKVCNWSRPYSAFDREVDPTGSPRTVPLPKRTENSKFFAHLVSVAMRMLTLDSKRIFGPSFSVGLPWESP
jgi:hypothetical protein